MTPDPRGVWCQWVRWDSPFIVILRLIYKSDYTYVYTTDSEDERPAKKGAGFQPSSRRPPQLSPFDAPPTPTPPPIATLTPAPSAPAPSCGQYVCMHVYIEQDADLEEVAADFRNQAPSVIIACCYDADYATTLAAALAKKAIETKPPVAGERRSKTEYQEQFMCVGKGEIVVAGRSGIVKDVPREIVQ